MHKMTSSVQNVNTVNSEEEAVCTELQPIKSDQVRTPSFQKSSPKTESTPIYREDICPERREKPCCPEAQVWHNDSIYAPLKSQ